MTIIQPRIVGIDSDKTLSGLVFVASLCIPLYKLDILTEIGVKFPERLTEKEIKKKAEKIMDKFDFWVEEIDENGSHSNFEYVYSMKIFKSYQKTLTNNCPHYVYMNFENGKTYFVEKMNQILPQNKILFDLWKIEEKARDAYAICAGAYILARFYCDEYSK